MPPVVGGVEDYGPLILAISWAEAGIAAIFLAARLYTNLKVVRRLKADFYLAALTYAVALIGQVNLTISVHYGLGRHIYTLSHIQISETLKYGWVFQILFILCMGLGKLAIIAFLLQIRGPHEPRPLFLYFIGFSTMVVNFGTIGLILRQCRPLPKLWDRIIPGNCNGLDVNQKYAYFQGSWSSFCDLALALYPVYICWRLQVPLRVKIGLCVLMGLGVIAAICSAIKTTELEALSHVIDIPYDISPLIIWTSTETWIILIVGCVPPIRPLFASFFQIVSPSRVRSYGRSQQHRYCSHVKSMRHNSVVPRDEDELYLAKSRGLFASNSSKVDEDGKGRGVGADDHILMTTKIDVDFRRANSPRPTV